MVVRAQEDAGGIGQAATGVREQGRGRLEGLQLAAVHRMARIGGAGQMAHHQAKLQPSQAARGLRQGLGLLDAEPQAVQAGVDVQGGGQGGFSAGKG